MSDAGLIAQALALLATDPAGLRGAVLRARAGPVRDAIVAELGTGWARIHPFIDDLSLFGGADVAATLAAGRVITRTGLLNGKPRDILIPMAERIRPDLAGRLCAALDRGAIRRLILLDEGVEAEETVPLALRDRLAFTLETEGLRHWSADLDWNGPRTACAQDEVIPVLTDCAASFGIEDLRIPHLALRAARAAARLHGMDEVCEEDIALAARLVLAPRATQMPAEEQPEAPEPQPAEQPQSSDGMALEDQVLDAVRAAIPADLLARIAAGTASGSGSSGAMRSGNRRGRPLPAREGGQGRIDLLATLRAAAPWQALRGRGPGKTGLAIRKSDLRIRRFEEHSDRLLIFAIDASGSAAMARLAEAKGAVEVLLAGAYASRDHVAVIAFRGTGAEILLPPTRALAMARRRLAALPGGGGTPLAAGLQAATTLARDAQRRGMAPVLVVMTDGRGNVALDPTAGRATAMVDATKIAGEIARDGWAAMLIDTAARPRVESRNLAEAMRAQYFPLPFADPRAVGQTIARALPV